VALAPKNNDNQTKLAVALARQGNAKEAQQLVKKVEQSKETIDLGFIRFEMIVLSAHAYRDIAEVYFRSGDTKKAWKYLAEAKKKGVNVTELEQQMAAGAPAAVPRRAKTEDLLEQGRAYYREERYELARQQLEQARTQDPKKEEVYYWLGRVASKQGKKDEARQDFQQALALKEKFPGPYLELARLAVDNEDYAGAMPHLRRYTELSPDGSEGQFLTGLCQYHLEDLASAENALKEAIRSESDYGDAFYILGRVYQKLQRNADALAELQLAVDSRTLSARWRPDAHYQLARLLEEAGKSDLAHKQARLASRYGHSQAGELLDELEEATPELANRSDDDDSDRAQGAFQLTAAPQGRLYELQRAQLGDPPGTLRSGQFNLGRIRVVRRSLVGGPVGILMRIWQGGAAQNANLVLFFAQVPVGEGEVEFDFRFMIPPNALRGEGSYQAAVSLTTPPAQGQMPKLLSNEVEVPFRLVP
jgi:tetratricopeptide (TPR) repeat protein